MGGSTPAGVVRSGVIGAATVSCSSCAGDGDLTRVPVATPYTLASYSTRNQERILDACPHATEVRSFHGWLAGGRVVKGQKGIRLVAPDTLDDGKITSIKPVYVFDVTQTQERTPRAAVAA